MRKMSATRGLRPSGAKTASAPRFALPLLGVLLGFLAPSAAQAQYEPPKQMTLTPTGVDLSTSRFTYQAVDLSIGPFKLERSYIGGPTIDGSAHFGLNWTHNYSAYVVEKDQSKTDGMYVVIGRKTVHFTWYRYGDPTCWNPDCAGQSLRVAAGGAFVYTDMQGNVYTFNPSLNAFPPPSNMPGLRNQRIDRIDYADGHALTYTYSGNQLRQIASNYGYSLVFEYGASGYISRACGYNRAVTNVSASTTCAGAALAVSYGYAPATWVNLTSVTDPMGQVWGYDYVGDSNRSKMTCVRQVNSSSCLIANNFSPPANQTLQQTTPDGAVWDIYFESGKDKEAYQQPGTPPIPYGGTYVGPEGITVSATFGAGLLTSYNANGRTTSLTWHGIELDTLTHPEGNSVTYFPYGEIRLGETWSPKPGSGLQPVSASTLLPPPVGINGNQCDPSIGPKLCNKPIWRKDFKGNQTDYTYEPHGGVRTETGPAVGGVRPQMRYEYALRRAWVSNGGGYAPEAVSIYLPSRKAFCATGAASGWGCAIAGDEVVTTYDYGSDSGPNNLLLRSETMTAGGVSRRTCHGYDWMGNKISTTRPNGLCQ